MLIDADIRKILVNGEQWGGWHGYHIPVSEQYVVIWTPLGTPMHWQPGTWISHKHALTYFWPDAWFTLHISYNSSGDFASGYCDVTLPTPSYTNTSQELIYTDLYIDVVIREDHSVYTKDHEVFDRAARHYPVVEQSRQKSFETLDWLEEHAQSWTGPFASIPRHLPRTDFETLRAEEAAAILQGSIKNHQ